MSYAMELTREQKREVFAMARELGMSPTALYRELGTPAPEPEAARVTIREDVEQEHAREVRGTGRAVSMAVTAACKREVFAARQTREHVLARNIIRALPGRGVMVVSRAGNRAASGVDVYAVTDRRGTLEYAGRVTAKGKRVRVYKWEAVGQRPEVLTEAALLDVLADLLPARIDSVPARFRDHLRPSHGPNAGRSRSGGDRTGEAATPGMADGAEFSAIARPARRGTRGLTEAHKREITRQRVARHRAKVRAERIAAEGREHALRPAEVQTVGEAALVPAKPLPAVPDTNDKTAVLAELATLRADREAWKAREAAREAVLAPVTVPEPEADPEPLTLF